MNKFKDEQCYQVENKLFVLKKEKSSFTIEINHIDDKGSETESENDEDDYNRMNFDYNYFLTHKYLINQRKTKQTIEIPIYDHSKKQNFLLNHTLTNNTKLVEQYLKAKKHLWHFSKSKCSLSFETELTEEVHNNPFEINFDLSNWKNNNASYDSNSNEEQSSIIYD